MDGYYDILAPRAKALLDHPAPLVRGFAAETVREIEVFQCSEDSYGYVFYVLQRAEPNAADVTMNVNSHLPDNGTVERLGS